MESNLENYSLQSIEDILVKRIQDELGVEDKTLATKLFRNAMTYNVVTCEVINQAAFLLEGGIIEGKGDDNCAAEIEIQAEDRDW